MNEKEMNKSPHHFSDLHKIGAGIWFSKHVRALWAQNQCLKEAFVYNENVENARLECKKCRKHALKYMSTYPPASTIGTEFRDGMDLGLFRWTVNFHNSVNIRTGKNTMSFEEALAYFLNNGNEMGCTSCGGKGHADNSLMVKRSDKDHRHKLHRRDS